MRRVGLIISLFVWLYPVAGAKAETISVSQKVYIRAIVLPTQTVIVDNNGTITEVISNTTQPVSPAFYKNSVLGVNQITPTKTQLAKYHTLITPSMLRPGIVYRAPSHPQELSMASLNKLNLLRL